MLSISPEFVEQLQGVPKNKRKGLIFNFSGQTGVVGLKQAQKIISKFGEKAGIKMPGSKDHATAHDLRRSFASRWAVRVVPLVLMQMMRHESIETTMKYYAEVDADALAEVIKQAHERSMPAPASEYSSVDN